MKEIICGLIKNNSDLGSPVESITDPIEDR